MAKFRMRSDTVEAVQFIDRPECMHELAEFLPDGVAPEWDEGGNVIISIRTLGGISRAREGDWIVRSEGGHYSVDEPEFFEMKYEPAEAEDEDR